MNDFSLGATYWPRRKGSLLWAKFDRGEIREEFQQLAAIGLNTLRLPLRWEDFQPRLERIALHALRMLEQTLDQASDARLQVVPQLLPLTVAGAIHIPAWTTAASYAADLTLSTKFGPLLIVRHETRPPLVWEYTSHETEVRDLWNNPAMRTAQRKLIGEVVGNFADHPTIRGWELGSGIELARTPSSSEVVAEWLGETVETAQQYGARGPLFYSTTIRSLVRREGPRPEIITQAGATPVINLVPPEPAFKSQPLSADVLHFVAALVSSLGRVAPVLVVGAPAVANAGGHVFVDRAYGHTIEQPLLDPDSYAGLIETALPELRTSGVAGVWFAHAFCYSEPFLPAEAHSRREQMMGLFDTDNSELPVAGAVQRFAQQPGSQPEARLPRLDIEDYWHDPATNFQRLWQDWQTPTEE
jgi:hypothetical protein